MSSRANSTLSFHTRLPSLTTMPGKRLLKSTNTLKATHTAMTHLRSPTSTVTTAGTHRRTSHTENAETTRKKVTAITASTHGPSLGSEATAKVTVPKPTFSNSGPRMVTSTV